MLDRADAVTGEIHSLYWSFEWFQGRKIDCVRL